jgi:hypothetical protein
MRVVPGRGFKGRARVLALIAVGGLFAAPALPVRGTHGGRHPPMIDTTATPSIAVGESATDTAVASGLGGGPTPTGTITFDVFGPNDSTCARQPTFTSASRPLSPGAIPSQSRATSGPFTPGVAGTYNWVATYSGDANYVSVTTPCNAPNETTVVSRARPSITTSATPMANLGEPISDTATLGNAAGPPAATGTIRFMVFGPNNPTCAPPAAFTSAVPVNGNGTYQSGPFTPTQPGIYQYVAAYSGDANYAPVATACNDPNETSTVTPARGDTTPPETVITGGPERRTRDRTPTFSFQAVEPGTVTVPQQLANIMGARFECSVDGGGFAPCVSPFTLDKLRKGQHVVEVRAIDVAGNVDPTPARAEFRVVKRKKGQG